MHVCVLESGPDRKLGIAVLLPMAYTIGVLYLLELLSRPN